MQKSFALFLAFSTHLKKKDGSMLGSLTAMIGIFKDN
jgi:hypothetical protein